MRKGIAVLIIVLCPTCKLAQQVQEELKEISRYPGLSTMVFHGGVLYDPQTRALRNGLNVLVGTPVQIIDHINNDNHDLSEADIKTNMVMVRRTGEGEMNTKEDLK